MLLREILKVLVKKRPLGKHFLTGEPEQKGNLPYGHFGDRCSEQLTHEIGSRARGVFKVLQCFVVSSRGFESYAVRWKSSGTGRDQEVWV